MIAQPSRIPAQEPSAAPGGGWRDYGRSPEPENRSEPLLEARVWMGDEGAYCYQLDLSLPGRPKARWTGLMSTWEAAVATVLEEILAATRTELRVALGVKEGRHETPDL